jgi:iron complex outermembrane recepter protein
MPMSYKNRWKTALRRKVASLITSGIFSLVGLGVATIGWAQEGGAPPVPEYLAARNFQDTPAPVQPAAEESAANQQSFTSTEFNNPFENSPLGGKAVVNDAAAIATESRPVQSFEAAPFTAIIGEEQALTRASHDVGSLMMDSPQTTGMSFFKRQMATSPYIRGYNSNQIQTQLNGQMWYQARPDQDTILSKIDSGIVENVVVVPGPYSALYGPGAAFIDVVTKPTLRSCGCGEILTDYRTVLNYDTNASGYYFREVVDLGGANYGVRASVGFRGASDYRSGNNERFNASYKARDIDITMSRDTADGGTLDFQYLRLDIDDAELYAQPFNMDSGVTNGFLGRYQTEQFGNADHLLLEGWYNQTQIAQGLPDNVGVVFQAVDHDLFMQAEQTTYGNSYGTRLITTYGDKNCDNTKIGIDFRGVKNKISEVDNFGGDLNPNGIIEDDTVILTRNYNLSNSERLNPGLLLQTERHGDYATLKYGGRLDHVQANPGASIDPVSGNPIGAFENRDFDLIAGFMSLDYHMNDIWTMTTSLGHSQRAPTNFELYTGGVFVAGHQHGLNFYTGNADLAEEKLTQVDLGLKGDYDDAHFMVRGYFSYVENYVTVQWNPSPLTNIGIVPVVVNGYEFVNSDSYFTGVEFNSDYDVTDKLSVFMNGSYTYGQDEGLFGGPVFGVYPFQSRTGVRLENGNEHRGSGLEFSARFVAAQDRVADGDRGSITPFAEEQITPGFQTMDLRGYFRARKGMLFTGGVTNLADHDYFEHFDFRSGVGTPQNNSGRVLQMGRNFYVGMELNY